MKFLPTCQTKRNTGSWKNYRENPKPLKNNDVVISISISFPFSELNDYKLTQYLVGGGTSWKV